MVEAGLLLIIGIFCYENVLRKTDDLSVVAHALTPSAQEFYWCTSEFQDSHRGAQL